MPGVDDNAEQPPVTRVDRQAIPPKEPATFNPAVSSSLRFFRNTLILCYGIMIWLAGSWWAGLLGESCRYYGSVVEQCNFLGLFSVDFIADGFLTPFVLPVVGIIAGLLAPLMYAFMLTIFLWPLYALVKFAVRLLRR